MRKFFFFLLVLPVFGSAQMPSYPEVVRNFFRLYTYENPIDPTEGIEFAKKKDGWKIMIVNRLTETVKKEFIFWSAAEKKYLPLSFAPGDPKHTDKADEYISIHAYPGTYGYERNKYFGYNGWPEDIIEEFGKGDLRTYPDTLIESLARAHSTLSTMFLWYQFGGRPTTTDSLRTKLGRLEKPSRRRVDSVNYYIKNAVALYKILYERNPHYETLVGNSGSKLFNEQMFGYLQMMLSGYEDLAKDYIITITPNENIRKQARNFLSACAPNSILFTYGDNDSYPLWWIQAAEGYRTDVTVINNSLLGIPIYLHRLKQNKQVLFSTTEKNYADSSFEYWMYMSEAKSSMTLPDLIKLILDVKKIPSKDHGPPYSFPSQTITWKVDTNRLKKSGVYANYGTTMRFNLEDYLMVNDFMILDIINSNFYTRPIYFTAADPLVADYLLEEGFIYRLLPLDKSKKTANENSSIKTRLKFVKEKLSLLPSNDYSAGITFSSFENNAYPLYASIASWYIKNKKPNEARLLINELLAAYKNQPVFSYYLSDLWFVLLEAGDSKALSQLEAYAKRIESLYRNPDPINGYLSKTYAAYYLDNVIDKLKQLNITNEKINAIRESL